MFSWIDVLRDIALVPLVSLLQGQLTEGTDVVDYIMEQANVVPRMNPLILSTDRKYLDFTASPGDSCNLC